MLKKSILFVLFIVVSSVLLSGCLKKNWFDKKQKGIIFEKGLTGVHPCGYVIQLEETGEFLNPINLDVEFQNHDMKVRLKYLTSSVEVGRYCGTAIEIKSIKAGW